MRERFSPAYGGLEKKHLIVRVTVQSWLKVLSFFRGVEVPHPAF